MKIIFQKKKSPALYISLALNAVLIISILLYAADRLTMNYLVRDFCRTNQEYVDAYPGKFGIILSSVFDEAQKCGNGSACTKSVSDKISATLGEPYFEQYLAESTYFIRLPAVGHIEKMFLNGNYYDKTIETADEQFVYGRVTKGKSYCRKKFFLEENFKNNTRLKDLAGEGENIIPVYNNMGTLLGAVVRIYGD